MLELTLQRSGKKLMRRPIEGKPITIGRGKENAVQLLDEDISRHHCRIEWKNDTLCVTDLSKNGTLINGRLSKEAELHAGDKLTLGPWTLSIESSIDAVPVKTVAASTRATQVLEFDPKQKQLTTQRIEIDVKSPDQAIMHKRLAATEITIGHHAACNIAIADPYVSRRHCKIVNKDGSLTLMDLASTNGTYVGDVRISQTKIPAQGVFRVGRSVISYRLIRASERISPSKESALGAMIGQSKAMREVFSLIEQIAPSDAAVCITGESGTGKELAAREIHRRSARQNGPFVAVNCGAVPANIIESQLFGHERGAFTGAVERAIGLFEQARDGTLFLDEIGEMPIELQTRLLRVLEDGRIRRIGGKEEIDVNFRLICATNRDIKRLTSEGRFREDLFFRIFVVPVEIPPLRERPADIPVLALHFIQKAAGPKRHPQLTESVMKKLTAYSWPGNVRELKNTIERTLILTEHDIIEAHDMRITPVYRLDGNGVNLREKERSVLMSVLDECGGNLSRASRKLGIARTTIQKKIKKYSLKVPGR